MHVMKHSDEESPCSLTMEGEESTADEKWSWQINNCGNQSPVRDNRVQVADEQCDVNFKQKCHFLMQLSN